MNAQAAHKPAGDAGDTPLETLASRLIAHQEDGRPFVLLLGSALAPAAGVPGLPETARRVFHDIYQRDPAVASLYLSPQMIAELQEQPTPAGDSSEQAWEAALQGLLDGLSSLARFSMLQRYLSRDVPVPRFYQDLARLLRDGYFNPVLTTNLDTLLEEALQGIGLQRGLDYQVQTPGSGRDANYQPESAPIQIFRLHADLALAEDVGAAWDKQPGLIGAAQPGEMLLVSYDFDLPPLNRALGAAPHTLWIVHPQAGEPPALEAPGGERRLHRISGPTAEPERFFGFLNTLLKVQLQQEGQYAPGAEERWPDPAELESFYLQDQLHRSRNVLAGLEQERALKGAASGELRQQINYQQQQIELLKDQLRPLSEQAEQVAELLGEIASQARRGGADHNSYLYLNYQARAVRREMEKPEVNQHVIATALEATQSLIDRLPADTVAEDQRQQLELLLDAPWEAVE